MIDVAISGCFRDKIFHSMPFDKLPALDVKNKQLILVLDPSSSQTGIVLGTMTGELIMLQDFKNLVLSKSDFTLYLNDYLLRLCRANNIVQMVYEVTYDRSRGDRASVVLTDLENNFKQYSRVLPNLTKDNMFPILPSVWRKNFLKDKEYDGMRKERARLKEITRKECNKRYPQYYDYFFKTAIPPDSTDAIGIYHGFLAEYWWDESKGIKQVSKVNSRYSKNQTYSKEIVAYPVKDILAYTANKYGTTEVELYAYNPDFDLDETIEVVTAQSNKPNVVLALDSTSLSLLRWSVTNGNASNDLNVCAIICKRTNERRN